MLSDFSQVILSKDLTGTGSTAPSQRAAWPNSSLPSFSRQLHSDALFSVVKFESKLQALIGAPFSWALQFHSRITWPCSPVPCQIKAGISLKGTEWRAPLLSLLTVRKTKGDKTKSNSFSLLKQVEFHKTDKLFTDCFTNSKWQWVNELSAPVTLLKLNQMPRCRTL